MNTGFLALTSAIEAVRTDRPRQAARPERGNTTQSFDQALDAAASRDTVEIGSSTPSFPDSYAKFAIQPGSGALSIKIVDAHTDEVIREIPSEQVLKIAEELSERTRRTGSHPATRAYGQQGGLAGSGEGIDRYA